MEEKSLDQHDPETGEEGAEERYLMKEERRNRLEGTGEKSTVNRISKVDTGDERKDK
jgi:hypothetical protein